ncbi:MAG: hypothetical protein J6N19_09155 [Clostridium sp.]|nr:hypothetical protein [Clostridium sp.]
MTAIENLLEPLKVDLGITTDAYNIRLLQYLDNARREIQREGVTLGDSVDDDQLVIMYAAWTWRRRDTGAGMPRMLRYALNNRVFSQKMVAQDG